jgi:hypothetical protein
MIGRYPGIKSFTGPAASFAGIRPVNGCTRAIVQIAMPPGISVHDHIIVGKNGHASLKGMKLI